MGAGELRKRVYFARAKRTDDGGGGARITWVPALTVWGGLTVERGREALAAGRLESSSGAVLKIRSSTEARVIDASYKATIDGVDYQVRSITEDPKRKYLEMVVERGVAING